MKREEKALLGILSRAGLNLMVDPDGSGNATVRNLDHDHLFYGNAAERRAFLRGIIAVVRKEVVFQK